MPPARATLIVGNLALAASLALTYDSPLGSARWHDDAALVALALGALALWPWWRRRHFTTLVLASAGAWSTLTGVALVYVTPVLGHGRWMRWFHTATSALLLLAFLAHWARNHPRLVGLARQLAARRRALGTWAGAWGALALVGIASWRAPLRALFDDRWFWTLTTASLLIVAIAVVYAAAIATSPRFRTRLAATATRNRLRAGLDASLLAAMWIATLTGFALLYLAGSLRGADAYWLVAGWHVILSALLVGLAFLHAGFNARPLAAHARR